MKKIVYILVLFFCVSGCANQKKLTDKNDEVQATRSLDGSYLKWLQDNQLIHPDSLDVPAQFPGGDGMFLKFLKDNTNYPQEAQDKGIEGLGLLTYIIEKDGNVSNIRMRTGLGGGCAEEMIRVVSQMPTWTPGTIDGKPKRVGREIRMWFKLCDGVAEVIPFLDRKAYSTYRREEYGLYDSVDIAPQFPGGEKARMRFLQNNITYPKEAREKGIHGTVYVSFVIEQDGSVSDIKVERGIGGGCDQETVRVIQKMPKWSPGMIDGKPVRVQFNMPMRFTLSGDTRPNSNQHNRIHETGNDRNRQNVNNRNWNR